MCLTALIHVVVGACPLTHPHTHRFFCMASEDPSSHGRAPAAQSSEATPSRDDEFPPTPSDDQGGSASDSDSDFVDPPNRGHPSCTGAGHCSLCDDAAHHDRCAEEGAVLITHTHTHIHTYTHTHIHTYTHTHIHTHTHTHTHIHTYTHKRQELMNTTHTPHTPN
jgi:hypothetical protein